MLRPFDVSVPGSVLDDLSSRLGRRDFHHDVMNAGGMRRMKEVAKQWLGSAQTPAAFANFPKDLSHPPRRWAERFFNVKRWTDMPRGGHFAALEVPDLLVQDIREFFRPLRRSS